MAWKYFKPEEMVCRHCNIERMDEFFMDLLDSLRQGIGRPLIVNSGYRCPEYDAVIGGSGNHTTGKAVDLRVESSGLRYLVIKTAFQLGLTRIGVAKTFIHVDIVFDKPQRVFWIY